ncbi:MAG: PTS transporter subunit EIIB [Streptococcus sp.]
MNYKETGQKILEAVGGKENVQNLTHCATRLRFTLADDSKTDDEAVQAIDGVVSLAKSGGQYQVVVGSDVPNVYRALEGLLIWMKYLRNHRKNKIELLFKAF